MQAKPPGLPVLHPVRQRLYGASLGGEAVQITSWSKFMSEHPVAARPAPAFFRPPTAGPWHPDCRDTRTEDVCVAEVFSGAFSEPTVRGATNRPTVIWRRYRALRRFFGAVWALRLARAGVRLWSTP